MSQSEEPGKIDEPDWQLSRFPTPDPAFNSDCPYPLLECTCGECTPIEPWFDGFIDNPDDRALLAWLRGAAVQMGVDEPLAEPDSESSNPPVTTNSPVVNNLPAANNISSVSNTAADDTNRDENNAEAKGNSGCEDDAEDQTNAGNRNNVEDGYASLFENSVGDDASLFESYDGDHDSAEAESNTEGQDKIETEPYAEAEDNVEDQTEDKDKNNLDCNESTRKADAQHETNAECGNDDDLENDVDHWVNTVLRQEVYGHQSTTGHQNHAGGRSDAGRRNDAGHQKNTEFQSDAVCRNNVEFCQTNTEVRNDAGRQTDAGHPNDAGHQNNTEFHSNACRIHDTEHQNNAVQQNNLWLKRKGEKGRPKEKTLNNDEKPSDNSATQGGLSDTESADINPSSTADSKKGKAKSRNEELKRAVTSEDKASDEKEFHYLMILPPPPKPELPNDAGKGKKQVRWTAEEIEAIRRIASSMVIVNPEKWHDLTAGTERRWTVIRDYLESKKLMKIDRTWGAIKNHWNRKLRESTGIDERRRPRTTELTTGFQPNRSRNEKAKKRKLAQTEDDDADNHNEEPIPKKPRAQIEQDDSSTKNKGSASKRKHAQAVDDSHQSQTYEPAPKKSRTWTNSEYLQQVAHQHQDYQGEFSQSSHVPSTSNQPSLSLTDFLGLNEFEASHMQQLPTQRQDYPRESPFDRHIQPVNGYQDSSFQDFPSPYQHGGRQDGSGPSGFQQFPIQYHGDGGENLQIGQPTLEFADQQSAFQDPFHPTPNNGQYNRNEGLGLPRSVQHQENAGRISQARRPQPASDFHPSMFPTTFGSQQERGESALSRSSVQRRGNGNGGESGNRRSRDHGEHENLETYLASRPPVQHDQGMSMIQRKRQAKAQMEEEDMDDRPPGVPRKRVTRQQAEQDARNEQHLQEMFPNFNREILGMIFAECDGNMDRTIDIVVSILSSK